MTSYLLLRLLWSFQNLINEINFNNFNIMLNTELLNFHIIAITVNVSQSKLIHVGFVIDYRFKRYSILR